MKTFALVWTVLFLGAVIPVMRYDHRLKIRKTWAKLNALVNNFGPIFVTLSTSARQAAVSMTGFSEAFAKPKLGQVMYETDTNLTRIWNGTDWVILSEK